jgi:hypothetical protein
VSDISTNSTWVIRHLSIPDKYVSFNRVWYITRFRCIYFIMNKKGRTSLSCGKHERPVLLNEFLTCWECWIRQQETHIYVSHKDDIYVSCYKTQPMDISLDVDRIPRNLLLQLILAMSNSIYSKFRLSRNFSEVPF